MHILDRNNAFFLWCEQYFQSFCAVHILDRNMVFSCSVGSIFNYFVHVRMVWCAFWSVTTCFLVAAAAAFSVIFPLCAVFLFFGAGHRKSYWSDCIKVAIVPIVIRQQIF